MCCCLLQGAPAKAGACAVGALAVIVGNTPNVMSFDECRKLLGAATKFFIQDDNSNLQAAGLEFLAECARMQQLEDAVADDRDARVDELSLLLGSKHGKVRTAAVKCVANLALHPEYTQVLGRSATVGPLLQLVAPAYEVQTRQNAGRAIVNLAANRKNSRRCLKKTMLFTGVWCVCVCVSVFVCWKAQHCADS